MTLPATALTFRPRLALVALGLASSLLYGSIVLSFAFLLPVQMAFGRSGRKAGAATVGIAAAGILVIQAARLVEASSFAIVELATGSIPPFVLLGALGLVNAAFWRKWSMAYRVLCVTAACSLAALPLVISIEKDTSLIAFLEERIASFFAPMKAGLGDGYDASALAASLDPKELVATSLSALRDSLAAILLFVIGGSLRLGNRMAGPGSRGREETLPIDEMRLPYPLIWAFLASWFLVLAARLLKAPVAASAVAWNCAFALSLAFAAQGWGIATYLLKHWNAPKALRVLLAIAAILALSTPASAIAVAIALTLIGVTEIWIPYRKTKGVGA